MSINDIVLRCFGFLVPWIAFSFIQYYLLKIQDSYAVMMYGGAAAIICLGLRDEFLGWIDKLKK